MTPPLSASLRAWRAGGRVLEVGGRSVFVRDRGDGPAATVLIHGFPGSSHDWSGLVPSLTGRVIAFDLPGYGFSDKDPYADYSLFAQADLVEQLLSALGVERCAVLAHDMGDTVTAELAQRSNEGALGFGLERIVLTNGSIFIDQAQLTRGQRLTLRLPDRSAPFPLPTAILRRSLLESFTRTAPPPPGAVDDLIAAIRQGSGDRLLPRLIRYLEERRRHQDRWTAGFVDFVGPLALIWGEEDPIAVLAMTRRLQDLRPDATVVTLPGVGHWPSIEAPDLLAGHLRELLDLGTR